MGILKFYHRSISHVNRSVSLVNYKKLQQLLCRCIHWDCLPAANASACTPSRHI